MPISHRERGLHWNSKRLDTPSPTPHPYEKNRGITFFWFFWWTCLGNVPPSGDLHGIKKFSQTCSMNMSGKKTTVDGTSKPWNIFPRHVHWTCLGKPPTLSYDPRITDLQDPMWSDGSKRSDLGSYDPSSEPDPERIIKLITCRSRIRIRILFLKVVGAGSGSGS